MTARWALVICLLAGLAVTGTALAASRYDHSQRDILADGLSVAGVAVGGMTVEAARARLQRELGDPLREPLTVHAADRTFQMTAERAQVQLDLEPALSQALSLSREGSTFTRVKRALFGHTIEEDIDVAPTHSRSAVKKFVARVKGAVDRDARDATLNYSTTTLTPVKSRAGRGLRAAELTQRIRKDLRSLKPTRDVKATMQPREPSISTSELRDAYPLVITVDRASNKLRLFKRLRVARTYAISVGREGYETPTGLYNIVNKQVNPAWHVPASDWAGSLAGQVIPGGAANNPLRARWMGVVGSVGIHGTSEEARIGGAASHGCIRMRVADVIDLYDRVPVGTPVYIQ